MSDLRCSISGCLSKHEARGLCSKHYQRLMRHGDALKVITLERDTINQVLADGHVKNNETECWEWRGTRNAHGYGVAHYKCRTIAAHRAAYECWVGPLVKGMQINHKCDNPLCINPSHLYQGTQKQNVADMITRNRINRKGVHCNGPRKLNDDQVRAIRKSSLSTRKAAAVFGVSQHTISDVRTGKSWSHLCQI